MKRGAIIKSMFAGLFALCVLAAFAGSSRADDWQRVPGGSDNVEVYVMKEPKVLGGVRLVHLKFVNRSDFNIKLAYRATIWCPSEGTSKKAAAGRSFVRRQDYDTTIISYNACANDSADSSSRIEVRTKQLRAE